MLKEGIMQKIVLVNLQNGAGPVVPSFINDVLCVFDSQEMGLKIYWAYESLRAVSDGFVQSLVGKARAEGVRWVTVDTFPKLTPCLERSALGSTNHDAVVYVDNAAAIRIAMSQLGVDGCDEIDMGNGPEGWVARRDTNNWVVSRRLYPVATSLVPILANESHMVAPMLPPCSQLDG